MAIPPDLARTLATLPDQPGVYLWKDAAGEIVYVGKAKSLRSRVRSYFAPDPDDSVTHGALVRHIAGLETIVVANEPEALLLENNLLKAHSPRFNVLLRDDK